LLVERGAGNPYFTEELVRWLIERGVIGTGPDAESAWWVHREPAPGLSVPGTVQGVLQARLERLDRVERATLQRAAVVGRAFWDGAVVYIGQEAVPLERWERLQQRDLVLRQPMTQLPGEREYHFRHVLLRDVVYEYTLKRQRRVFHRRAAEWLGQVAAERADEWAAVIAAHYEQAGETAQAANWYGQAGKQAQAAFAPVAAIDYYQKALALSPEGATDAARRLELYEGLGRVLRWQARYAEAADAYRAMEAAAEAAGDGAAQARAWERLGDVQDSQGDHRAALESAVQAEGIARAVGARVELALGLFGQGWAYMRLGDMDKALALGQEALALGTELDARPVMARSQNLVGIVYKMLGDYEQAARYQERALALFRELGDRRRVAGMLNNLGVAARFRGDCRAAVALYEEALTIAREIGDRDWEMAFLTNLGGARVELGEFGTAEADLRQVIDMSQPAGWLALSETYCFLAEACLGQGRVGEALAAARKALALGQESGQQMLVGAAWRVLGRAAAHPDFGLEDGAARPAPEISSPAACFAESLRIFTEVGAERDRAQTLQEWARYELEQGDRDRGEEMWRQAHDIFDRLGIVLS
jgi:tetratricopeptide (TPR) repeat protein